MPVLSLSVIGYGDTFIQERHIDHDITFRIVSLFYYVAP